MGAERSAHFTRVHREARVARKPAPPTKWDRAHEAAAALPQAWRAPMEELIARSRAQRKTVGQALWSADHTYGVILALTRWARHCARLDQPLLPYGTTLEAYAQGLVTGAESVTVRTASDYLKRIMSGLAIVEPGFASEACSFVVTRWDARAKEDGASTKSGGQLVGATEIYRLGFDLMAEARGKRHVGAGVAKVYRNGLLLAMAVALPHRARALSCLAFERSLFLEGQTIHVRIPPDHLKRREDRKTGAPLELSFQSDFLAAALHLYRSRFRPPFDDSDWLFPSILSPGAAISSNQIGRLTGDLTEKHFGVRVPVHRVRDNVATEASETLEAGGRAAAALLGHRDLATTRRHYDHSTGIEATRAFGELIEARRGPPVDLEL